MKTVSGEKVRLLRYRKQFLEPDRRQMTIVIVLSTIAMSLSVRNDYVLLHGTSLFLFALVIRAGHILLTAAALVLLRETQSIRRFECAGTLWNLGTAATLVTLGLTRLSARELQGPFLGVIAALCVFYFAERGFLTSRLIAAGTITAFFIFRLLQPGANASSAARMSGIVLLLFLTAIGLATVRSFEQQRLAGYDAKRQEKRMRLELMAKNRDLAEQKERAEAMSRSRATFLAAMSHEFRTPMNAIIGLSDVLVNAEMPAEYRDHVRTIQDSARALLSLLNDILDFSKIDAGKLALSPTAFDLRALLGSVVDMMQPAASAKKIKLEGQFARELPDYLIGDDARLRQVLVNFLSNAIKFTSKGLVLLQVTSVRREKDIYSIEFSVKDTGVGMSSDVVARLFRPFEQGDEGIGRRYGGTGLGLAISRQIIVAMGGDVHVESEVGKGTTFSFTLQMPESDTPVIFTSSGIRKPIRNPQSLAILVVDDMPINRKVAQVMLDRLGFSADLAQDGFEAVECVKKKDYDLILMDLQMPGMGGIEATKCIREQLAGKHVPKIVAVSASVFEEDRAACREAGMREFIAKPIDISVLGNVLTRLLGQKERPLPSVPMASPLDPTPLDKLRELEALGEPGFVADLCREFLEEMTPRLARMKKALDKKEWKELEREAHSLKSSSATLGAMEMSTICAAIESAAREKRSAELPEMLVGLAVEMPRVEEAMRRDILK